MYTITALQVGTIYCAAISCIARIGTGDNIGEIRAMPCYAWLLRSEDRGKTILVDAGPPLRQEDVSPVQDRFEREESLTDVLLAHGVEPGQLDACILTHLHWDTAYGAKELGGCKILLQREEIRYAIAPYTLDAPCYDLGGMGEPFYTPLYWNMKFLDGDARLDDDLRIVALPGHTPGSQGVMVNTTEGKVFPAGDIAYTLENLRLGIPSGIRMDSRDAMRAMDRLARMEAEGVKVIPSRDKEAQAPFLVG